ncbi:hypothetical protein Bca52824_039319 [Brassica carinata]|uniref:Leucine-rich repeat-containing N-terminal plant-type domain-containing protein n=1 Tax=Brassica carinata TaxID=52824 RepID=A0A8X7UUH1_BRACI|nr:hypothetical protein Bca52824_039319 [Brassica carinata]
MNNFEGAVPTEGIFAILQERRAVDITDQSILCGADDPVLGVEMVECLSQLVYQVGVRCSEESPVDRISMAEALRKLVSVRDTFIVAASTFTDQTDKQALLEFQSNLSPNSRVSLASWNESFDLCNWTGVTCARKHKRVSGLNLSGMKLTGVISPSIGNLSFLTSVSLSHNSFHGSIPPEVGKLFRLQHLNLSNNVLGGGIPLGLSNCSALLNNLEHEIPSELASLSSLVLLSLRGNALTGKFPASFGNLTSLERLDLAYNRMEEEIHESMSRLTKIKFLRLAKKFSGVFPPAIYNLSSLLFLSIPTNSFSGQLRLDVDLLFPNIQVLFLGGNDFEGSIPLSFGRLHELEILGFSYNSLGSYSSRDLDFLGAMTNCTQLQYLNVGMNKLGGSCLSITNLSTQLTELSLGINFISGSIPHGIANLVPANASFLPRWENFQNSEKSCSIQINSLEIPSSLGNITWLTYLYLINNSFVGSIPSSLGRCNHLLDLNLGTNKLNGSIPHELMELPSLIILNVSFNSLVGPLREDVGNLKFLLGLDVSYNKLSGQIPPTLGNCLSLEYLWLQGNAFVGPIPDIRRLTGLRFLDLSKNNLSGPIPEYLANFSKLQNLNLSMNNLEGAVPTEGIFGNTSAMSIVGNINLCGGIPSLQLEPCSEELPGRHSSVRKIVAICVSAALRERRALDITDQSVLCGADEVEMVECLSQLVYQVGIRCSEESPVNRISMSEALSKLVSVRDTFLEDGLEYVEELCVELWTLAAVHVTWHPLSLMRRTNKHYSSFSLTYHRTAEFPWLHGMNLLISATGLELHVPETQETGVISPSIGNLSFLTSLSLAHNSFHGSIPPDVGTLFRLQQLNLSNNVLGGGIPRGLSNCSALLTSDLSSNNLEHEIPSELASLSSLVLLSLRGNALTGKFPASFGNLTSLERLDLAYNRMEEEIPHSMAKLTRIKFLRLALNKFSGVFPPAIYNLSSLLFLSIPTNSFSGQLRLDVDLLFPNIQVLFLGGNDFEGQIPSSLANITCLREFDIAE